MLCILPTHRKPCLKASSFASAVPPPSEGDPIRVASKPKRRRKSDNVFLDDRGFPDQSDEYDHLLYSIGGGPVLRKLRHPMPDLHGPIDPSFDHPFVPKELDAIIRQKVDLSHLTTDQQNQVYDLIREFWPAFNARGVFVTVKNYECVIDTSTARPIAVKKILYGK